jgi:hypothetical protein
MKIDKRIDEFLSNYDEEVFTNALKLRDVLLVNLSAIIEQIDFPAKMIAYSYGQKYTELICTVIPSKKGLKLGFNKGADLPDPDKLLAGKGKISRFVEISSVEQIQSAELTRLIASALAAYKERVNS